VTLSVIMLKIQLCITGIKYILKYILKKQLFLIIIHRISVFTVFLIK